MDEILLREAYERSKEDVDVSHILIRIPQNALPTDTLKAWNEINTIWRRLERENFSKLAKEISQDESAEKNSGRLGWISVFRTVYPFESAAYNTAVGSYSKPIRTAFGYHIVKVHARRKTLGDVLVSHIMILTNKGDDVLNKRAKITIDSLYHRLTVGEDFGALARKYSQDKTTSSKNGELPWFGSGRMVPEFEKAAFALKNVGEISKPIQTNGGWHILKLLDKKGIASFDELKADLERKVKRDDRSKSGQHVFLAKLRNEYNYKLIPANLTEFYKLAASKKLTDSTFIVEATKLNKPIFSFASKNYSQIDFAKFLKENPVSEKSSPK